LPNNQRNGADFCLKEKQESETILSVAHFIWRAKQCLSSHFWQIYFQIRGWQHVWGHPQGWEGHWQVALGGGWLSL